MHSFAIKEEEKLVGILVHTYIRMHVNSYVCVLVRVCVHEGERVRFYVV
jgi:hypothetical protein